MNRYKIIVAYDGTDYQGWQSQPSNRTIADVLEKTFFDVFEKKIFIFGASRTDAGVHALGQVATFKAKLPISTQQTHKAWSNRLPESISIISIEKVSPDYNPHHNIIEKTYEYTFSLKRPSPFAQRYQYYYRWPISIQKLQDALFLFLGKHDFRSFCANNNEKATTRTINTIKLAKLDENTYTITFKGPGFLHNMIRRITGACLKIATQPNLTTDTLIKTLNAKNPRNTLPCAPAKGLVLKKITYKNIVGKNGNPK